MGLVVKSDLEQAQQDQNQSGLYSENLEASDWLGIIVDNHDPLFLGRARVRVFEKFNELADEDLPWAFPQQSTVFAGSNGNGSFSFPKKNTLVRVKFQAGDWTSPEYSIVENINKTMQNEIKESYTNAQVLVYDDEEDLKIIYTQSKGLYIWNKGAYVNLTNSGNVIVNHAGDSSSMTLVGGDITHSGNSSVVAKAPTVSLDTDDCRLGSGAGHPAVKGDELMALLQKMAIAIDTKFGAPSVTVAMVAAADTLSSKVFVAD